MVRSLRCGSTLLLILCLGLPLFAQDEPPLQFETVYGGETLPLDWDRTRVAIDLEGVPADALRALAESLSPEWTSRIDLERAEPSDRPSLLWVPVTGELERGEWDALFRDLDAQPSVRCSAPALSWRGAEIVPMPSLIVTLKPGARIEPVLAAESTLRWSREFPGGAPCHLVEVPTSIPEVFEIARRLRAHPSVDAVDPNFVRFLATSALPNDPFLENQWYHRNYGQRSGIAYADAQTSSAWDVTTGSSAVTVAVLDNGVDVLHPDLAAAVVTGHDATTASPPGGIPGNAVGNAHGTACAGLIGAVGDNGIGVTGVCWNVSIMPVRIFQGGSSTDAWILDGLTWAVDNGADILSNSWGGGPPTTALQNACQYALDVGRGGLGSPVFFAAGNDNTVVDFPAAFPQTIAVGASSPCDERKSPSSCDGETFWGSNFGPEIDLVAPGVLMSTTDISGPTGYSSVDYVGFFNGTSSATPVVAGAAALLLSYDPTLTAAEVRTHLQTGADDQVGRATEDLAGFDNHMGHGRLNLATTIALLGTPAAPTGLVCTESGVDEVTLNWTNGEVYASIEILEGGDLVANLAGTATSHVLTGIGSNFSHIDVRGVVNGNPSPSARCDHLPLGNARDLVFRPGPAGTVDGAMPIGDALIANGRDVILATNLGIFHDLDLFDRIWVNLGVFPSKEALAAFDAARLEEYLLNGVGGQFLYLEGADTWVFDPQTPLHDLFAIDGLNDGVNGGDLATVVGTGSGGCDLTGLNLVYTGENNFIDRLAPLAGGSVIQTNSSPVYNTAIFHDAGTYRTIGASFEFGGFFDGSTTKADLIAAYISCFEGNFVPSVSTLVCASSGADVSLGWINGTTYDAIEVRRDGVLIATLGGGDTLFDDLGRPPGTAEYQIVGIVGGDSSAAETCTVNVQPDPVTGLTCNASGSSVTLNWTASVSATSIDLRRDGIVIATLPGTATSAIDGAAPGGMRNYAVEAVTNGVAATPASCTVSVTPQSVTTPVCSEIAGFIQVVWTNPESYDAIEIRRDGAVIDTLLGTQTSFVDGGAPAGLREYAVVGRIDALDAAPSSCTIALPPSSIMALSCSAGAGTATLGWTNGDTYDEIEIRRGGVAIATLAGTATGFTDPAAPAGSQSYQVVGRITGADADAVTCFVDVTPTAVSSLSCAGSQNSATLSWTNTAGYGSLEVRRDGALIATLAGPATTYVDTTPTPGAHTYGITGVLTGLSSPEATCAVDVLLAPITAFSCPTLGGSVAMTWTLGDTYTAIEVRRDGVLLTALAGTATSFVDSAPLSGQTLYSLTPLSGGASAPVTECTSAVAPAAINDLALGSVDPCACTGTLTWTVPEPADAIEVLEDGVLIATLPGTATSHPITLPTPTALSYCVRPVIDSIPAPDACLLEACPTVATDPIGALSCSVDLPTCTAMVSWPVVTDATSLEVLLDGVSVQVLAGTATSATVSLVGSGTVETIEVRGTNLCGTALVASSCSVSCSPAILFIRGDATEDGALNISDPIRTLTVLFEGFPTNCMAAFDTNADDTVDVADVIASLEAIFGVAGLPPAPFPGCGLGAGTLDCTSFNACP